MNLARLLGVVVALGMSAAVLSWPILAQAQSASRNATNSASSARPEGAARPSSERTKRKMESQAKLQLGLSAEARLLKIYQMIGQGQSRIALREAEQLVADHPNFALAQLTYGDLLVAQTQALRGLGNVPEATARSAPGELTELREQSLLRLQALRDKPAPGTIPLNFIRLSAQNKHAIAVDASRSRVYLFENTPQGLKLIADYYASVGRMGMEKQLEGDLKTPIGIYYATSSLDPASLEDFYGVGALPINYPNPYDLRRGKTGYGIWLHGVPRTQFARSPKATEGCVVLSNADMDAILSRVQIRTTPVVILPKLEWGSAEKAAKQTDVQAFEQQFAKWQATKLAAPSASSNAAQLDALMQHYTADFDSYGKKLADWRKITESELLRPRAAQAGLQWKDTAVLYWPESAQSATMVVTFAEVWTDAKGRSSGSTKRQYWLRSPATSNQWKIFFEGVIG